MRIRRAVLMLLASVVFSALPAPAAMPRDDVFFDGKTLDGWEGLTDYWSVKDGAIVGSAPKGISFNTFLCTRQKYKDFEFRFEIQLKNGDGNSGVQIRSLLKDPKTFTVWGPQCDIGEGFWGTLFGEHHGPNGSHVTMKEAPKEVVSRAMPKKGEFVDYQIKAVGKHVTIKLNGLTTVDDDFPTLPDEGIIALQLHAGGPMEVIFRKIEFKNLSK